MFVPRKSFTTLYKYLPENLMLVQSGNGKRFRFESSIKLLKYALQKCIFLACCLNQRGREAFCGPCMAASQHSFHLSLSVPAHVVFKFDSD